MKFQPGQSGNPSGRPKGVGNKTTEQLRGMLKDFINQNIEDLQQTYNDLEAKDKMRFFVDLVKIILPPPISVDRLTPEQMEDLLEQVKIKFNGEQERNIAAN